MSELHRACALTLQTTECQAELPAEEKSRTLAFEGYRIIPLKLIRTAPALASAKAGPPSHHASLFGAWFCSPVAKFGRMACESCRACNVPWQARVVKSMRHITHVVLFAPFIRLDGPLSPCELYRAGHTGAVWKRPAMLREFMIPLVSLCCMVIAGIASLDKLCLFHQTYQSVSARLESERWLLEQCSDALFFSRMHTHSDLCFQVPPLLSRLFCCRDLIRLTFD